VLDVVRQTVDALQGDFGAAFWLEQHRTPLHLTPAGDALPFTYWCGRLIA
jgi:hypothetical protein